MERLQKYMARCGVASRRKCEELIVQGRVKVNGRTVKELGVKIDPDADRVEVDGKALKEEKRKVYIMLNKPAGYVTTVRDQFGRPTVLDLVKGVKERIYPVGRLDYDTRGLLLLTNDGKFAHYMTHPSHQIEKVYHATVKGIPSEENLERLRRGIKIEGYVTSPAKAAIIKKYKDRALLELTIREGRNRQVRKMCDAIGHPVIKLKRMQIGKLKLGNLKEGEWRYLEKEELGRLGF